jgi:hypothetical protein
LAKIALFNKKPAFSLNSSVLNPSSNDVKTELVEGEDEAQKVAP